MKQVELDNIGSMAAYPQQLLELLHSVTLSCHCIAVLTADVLSTSLYLSNVLVS